MCTRPFSRVGRGLGTRLNIYVKNAGLVNIEFKCDIWLLVSYSYTVYAADIKFQGFIVILSRGLHSKGGCALIRLQGMSKPHKFKHR